MKIKTPSILLYFPSGCKALYQIKQWEEFFVNLGDYYSVRVLFRRPDAYYRYKGKLNSSFYIKNSSLCKTIEKNNPVAIFYLNNSILNFWPLQYHTIKHIFLGYGDSEKVSSYSYHMKAFVDEFYAYDRGKVLFRPLKQIIK